jgi:DMSO/TMAO reductase YedYZ heme-binding membrane subunit
MSLFRNERFLRVLRPVTTAIGLGASIWHATHTLSMWRQMQEYKTSDPSLSDFFYASFQMELAVTLVAFASGVIAWHLFKPRAKT